MPALLVSSLLRDVMARTDAVEGERRKLKILLDDDCNSLADDDRDHISTKTK